MNAKHIFLYRLLRPLVILFTRLALGYRYTPCKPPEGNYLVLANHTTDFDPILVGVAFPKQIYFVASEHVARFPVAGKLLTWVFDPIYRSKGASAAGAVMEILRRIRKGASVCMFPEGVRTWDGVTCPIAPSTAKMLRSAKCGLITFRMEGGYFTSPMWGGASIRKGKLRGGAVGIYSAQEVAAMTQQQLHEIICRDLAVDACALQKQNPQVYRHRRGAEHLENLVFLCPHCGKTDTLRSKKDTVRCTECGHSFTYDRLGTLHGTRWDNIRDLAAWQKQQLQTLLDQGRGCAARQARLRTLQAHVATDVAQGSVCMLPDGLTCAGEHFPMEQIRDLAMHGQRTLVFTAGGLYYELVVEQPDNALKFYLYYQLCRDAHQGKAG